MAGHGGARPGAGKPKGSKARATREQKATFAELAKALAPEALQTLAHVMRNSESDSARVAASNSIMDRAYGKPMQAVEHSGPEGGNIPFDGWEITRAKPDPA